MQKVQKATVALKIAVGIVVASIMVLIAGILVPFNPMTFGEYNVMPRSVCPGEPVEVQYTAKLDGGLYTIDRLDGNAHWVYPPNQKPYDSDVIDVDELNKTDGKYIVFDSAIQRIAPLPQANGKSVRRCTSKAGYWVCYRKHRNCRSRATIRRWSSRTKTPPASTGTGSHRTKADTKS